MLACPPRCTGVVMVRTDRISVTDGFHLFMLAETICEMILASNASIHDFMPFKQFQIYTL